MEATLSTSQIVVRGCLFAFAAIAVFGGSLQMYLGQPGTSPRLDNIHRFMAGIYLFMGVICAWAAITVRQQGILVYLIAALGAGHRALLQAAGLGPVAGAGAMGKHLVLSSHAEC